MATPPELSSGTCQVPRTPAAVGGDTIVKRRRSARAFTNMSKTVRHQRGVPANTPPVFVDERRSQSSSTGESFAGTAHEESPITAPSVGSGREHSLPLAYRLLVRSSAGRDGHAVNRKSPKIMPPLGPTTSTTLVAVGTASESRRNCFPPQDNFASANEIFFRSFSPILFPFLSPLLRLNNKKWDEHTWDGKNEREKPFRRRPCSRPRQSLHSAGSASHTRRLF